MGITVVGGIAIVEGMDKDSCLLVKAWNEEFFPFYTPEDITASEVLILLKPEEGQKWVASARIFRVMVAWNERH